MSEPSSAGSEPEPAHSPSAWRRAALGARSVLDNIETEWAAVAGLPVTRRLSPETKPAWTLEGSVRVDGAYLRVWARLVESATGYDLWSQRYDRALADSSIAQDEIASAIRIAMCASLTKAIHISR